MQWQGQATQRQVKMKAMRRHAKAMRSRRINAGAMKMQAKAMHKECTSNAEACNAMQTDCTCTHKQRNGTQSHALAAEMQARAMHQDAQAMREGRSKKGTYPEDQPVQQHSQQGKCQREYSCQNIAIALRGKVRQALRLHLEKWLQQLLRSRPGHLGLYGRMRTADGSE